jgi:hypothetical protein
VNLRRNRDGDEVDEFLAANAVGNALAAGSKTDAEGRFQLNPLPPGTYRLDVRARAHDPSVPREGIQNAGPLDHVFPPMEVTIAAGEPADPIEIRAMPHVILRGRFFDGQGNPRASHEQHVFGEMNGQFVFAESTLPGKDGWFEFKLPHGVQRVRLRLTTNEHSSLRWRRTADEPLVFGHEIEFDRLEEDFTTLEVVRYEAPILLLKAVDEDGNQLRGFIPHSKYDPLTKPTELLSAAPWETSASRNSRTGDGARPRCCPTKN